MASIKRLFDEITIIRPEKLGKLGEQGLEDDLSSKLQLLANEIWMSLPLQEEYSMPFIDSNSFVPLTSACCPADDVLECHLSSVNESINTFSILLKEIQKRVKVPQTNLKKSTKMPQSLQDCHFNASTGKDLSPYSMETGESALNDACKLMGVPYSVDNFLNYGEMLFCAYENAAKAMECYIKDIAAIVMTEDEIKDLVEYNEYKGVYFPSLYEDEGKLRNLCNLLINHGYLDKSTSIDDFTYFFSGKGTAPKQSLIWQGNNVELATFIDCYFVRLREDFPKKWKVVQKIFNKKNLRQTLNNFLTTTNQELINKRNQIFYDMLD